MPRIDLPLTEINRNGVAPGAEVTADPANDHSFNNDGRVFLLVRNAHATVAQTVTIVTPGTVDDRAIADLDVSVPATASRYIGPFPPSIYGSPVNVDVTSADLQLTTYRLA